MLTKKLKAEWIKALKSGEYKQAHGDLKKNINHYLEPIQVGYCCLGVLCVIANIPIKDTFANEKGSYYHLNRRLTKKVVDALIVLNDSKRKPFEYIANYISRYVKAR